MKLVDTFLMMLFLLACNGDGVPPIPHTPDPVTLTGITLNWSTVKKAAEGSDNFATTLAANGAQYTTWGDGWGFDEDGSKTSLGVSAIVGDFDNPTYMDLWREGNGKSYGILGVNGAIFMWVGEWGSMQDSWNRSRLYLSTDWSASWAICYWYFTKDNGFHCPTFLQAGMNYEDAQDDYVYSYAGSNDLNAIYCFRAHKDHILEQSYWEFFAGDDTWSNDINAKQPVLTGSALDHCSVTYFKDLNKYVMATQHSQIMKGNLLLLQADNPWGPFTEFYSGTGIGEEGFFWNFSQRWSSLDSDGLDFVLIYTGINEQDAFHSIRGSFITNP